MTRRIRNLRLPGSDRPLASPADVTAGFDADGLLGCFRDTSLHHWLDQNGFAEHHRRVAAIAVDESPERIVRALGEIFERPDAATTWLEREVARPALLPATMAPSGDAPALSEPVAPAQSSGQRSRTLLAAFGNGDVKAFDVATWRETWMYKRPRFDGDRSISSGWDCHAEPVGFAADGRYLVAIFGEQRYLRLVDLASEDQGEVLAKGCPCAAVSSDGTLLAFRDGAFVLVLDLPSGRPVDRWLLPEGYLNSLAFSADGRRIACFFNERIIQLRDLGSRTTLVQLDEGARIHAGTLSPDGRHGLLASFGDRAWGVKYRVEPPNKEWGVATKGHGLQTGILVSPDGSLLAIWSLAGGVTLHDLEDGKVVLAPDRSGVVESVAFGNGRAWVAVGTNRGIVTVWGTDEGQVVATPLGEDDGQSSFRLSESSETIRCLQFVAVLAEGIRP